MKNFRLLFAIGIMAFVFSSCQHNDNTIRGTTTTPHEYTVNGVPSLWDTVTVNGQVTTKQSLDTLYQVSPTWYQARAKAKSQGYGSILWLGIFGGLAAAGATFGIGANSKGGMTGGYQFLIVIFLIIGCLIGFGSMEWGKWNSDKYIPQKTYDSLIKADGDLHAFWQKQ